MAKIGQTGNQLIRPERGLENGGSGQRLHMSLLDMCRLRDRVQIQALGEVSVFWLVSRDLVLSNHEVMQFGWSIEA